MTKSVLPGWGLYHAIDVAAGFRGFELEGARIVIQGFGAVGRNAARFLHGGGAKIIAVADSGGAVVHRDGLDVEDLIAHKAKGLGVADFLQGESIPPEDLVGLECEVWIPAARPDVIHEGNAGKVRAKIVAQGGEYPLYGRSRKNAP